MRRSEWQARCLKKITELLGGGEAMGRRLGLGALLVALRKVHGRRDEESGRASPHVVIEARVVAEAHATLWIFGLRVVQGLVQGADEHIFGGA